MTYAWDNDSTQNAHINKTDDDIQEQWCSEILNIN